MANKTNAAHADTGRLVRTPFIWTLYLVLSLFAFMLSMIGPMVPYLREEFGMDYALAGLHQSAFALGMVIMGLSGGYFIKRLGIGLCLWGGMVDMLVGLLLMVLAKGPALTLGGVFVMSLGGTVTMSAVQTSFANGPVAHRGKLIMEGNVAASIVGISVPSVLLFGAYIGMGWRVVFPVMLVSLAAVAIFGIPATRDHLRTRDQKADAGGGTLGAGYWRMWVLVFFSVSVEWAIGFWCMTYLLSLTDNSRDLAAAGTTLLALSIVVGRFVSSRMGHRVSEEFRLVIAMAMVLAGFPLYWLHPTIALTFAGLVLGGMGASNFYPLIVAIALRRASGNAAKATSFIPVASGSAIALAPFLLGRLADAVDIHTALLYIPIGMAIMSAVFAGDRIAGRRERQQDHGHIDSERKHL
jgi:fucose permease